HLTPRSPPSPLFPYPTLFLFVRPIRCTQAHCGPNPSRQSSADPASRQADHCPSRLEPAPASRRSAPRVRQSAPPVRLSSCRQHRSEEHTSELQSLTNLVCRLL